MDGTIKIDGKNIHFIADYQERVVDDSFSHAFGVEHRCHVEPYDIEIESLADDDDNAIPVSDAIIGKVTAEIEKRI